MYLILIDIHRSDINQRVGITRSQVSPSLKSGTFTKYKTTQNQGDKGETGQNPPQNQKSST